ncbi:MAG: hypothetical protein HFH91_19330 [Lachnospiraceae bacterium]|nr:hypothetical protein [Lachnospiraceae bacterium]
MKVSFHIQYCLMTGKTFDTLILRNKRKTAAGRTRRGKTPEGLQASSAVW